MLSQETSTQIPKEPTVALVSLSSLQQDLNDTLRDAISTAFGTPNSLGLILIKLPQEHVYHSQRKRLLALAPLLASLPESEKAALEHPTSSYSFGWSHGKESFNGKPDTAKGSFYAQIYERTDLTPEFTAKYPSYGYKNIWPSQSSLPDSLQDAFLDLGKTISQTGTLLAKRLDQFLVSTSKELSSLEDALSSKHNCHKGRLLYYFPKASETPKSSDDTWCSLHLDHSLLTGLVRAITNPESLPSTNDSGLYIQHPTGEFTRVSIPEDCIAFQIGQAARLLSNGVLRATPHMVKGSCIEGINVERSTFACFLQPDPDFVLTTKTGSDGSVISIQTFGQFSEKILKQHY
ncbi:UNVERIFIED_CONTAM: hypothetical protein HDU68_011257 [Siphonaria sp. JEL0065]|nr:hypothetical protein HDU68_011257 [Siphonaria sp. JEL0065]